MGAALLWVLLCCIVEGWYSVGSFSFLSSSHTIGRVPWTTRLVARFVVGLFWACQSFQSELGGLYAVDPGADIEVPSDTVLQQRCRTGLVRLTRVRSLRPGQSPE